MLFYYHYNLIHFYRLKKPCCKGGADIILDLE